MLDTLLNYCTIAARQIVLALLIWIIGKAVIKKLLGTVGKLEGLSKLDPTVRKFAIDAIRIVLYIVLVISIIGVLGVPMASVITVLASAGVAVGMAMQGSLSNLAGGIMLMIFRPFNVGNYISAAGADGTVKEINLFYTVLTTVDNRQITIPNGSLMNTNVTNFSGEDTRRVDLTFACAKGTDVEKVCSVMLEQLLNDGRVLKEPSPFARLTGGTNESMEFTARAWVNSGDYWDVYFDLTQNITEALGKAGVEAPAVRVITK